MLRAPGERGELPTVPAVLFFMSIYKIHTYIHAYIYTRQVKRLDGRPAGGDSRELRDASF